MKTDEVMQVLLRQYPNGVSFTPMALRLLRQKVPLEDSQIEGLKAQMFQLGDGLWFFRDMIADEKTQLAIRRQATAWLNKQGWFSAERLFEGFGGVLRHVSTLEQFATFLRHLGFTVTAWKRSGFFCFQAPPGLDERLTEGSRAIVELLDEAGGTLALNTIQGAMSHLSADALEGIRVRFLPEVHRTEIGGHPCWRSTEAIHLPEDFAEKVTTTVDTLVALGKKVTPATVEFALNLSYGIRFREVYGLPDNGAFMRACAKHYQGANDVFPSATRHSGTPGDMPPTTRRTRSANTRFGNLGIPIGAELVFTKDSQVTCTVLDDVNQVECQGKRWAISVLAMRLLNVSGANGFSYFSYEGETLWDRRLRLNRDDSPDAQQRKDEPPPIVNRRPESGIISSPAKRTRSANTCFRDLGIPIGAKLVFTKDSQVTCTVLDGANKVIYGDKTWPLSRLAAHLLGWSAAHGYSHFRYEGETLWERRSRLDREAGPDARQTMDEPPPTADRRAERDIIGLGGQALHPATWRAFKSAGTNPRVGEWARRVEDGESVETIARETGLVIPTVKEYINNRRRYLCVCEKNGISPETGADV